MGDSWLVLGVFGAAILAAVSAMVVAVGMGVHSRPTTRPAPVPAELQARVRTLLRQHSAIHAIREVREATGLGLREAGDVVEALRGRPSPPEHAPGPYEGGARGSLADRARRLRDGGDLADAVALVCAETGMTQREAERFVSALDQSVPF
jgi:large subunit ribosomal protein L7/L12